MMFLCTILGVHTATSQVYLSEELNEGSSLAEKVQHPDPRLNNEMKC